MFVRVGQRRQRYHVTAFIALVCGLAAGCSAGGCGFGVDVHGPGDGDSNDSVRIAWTLDPSPPFAGTPLVVRLTLRDREQQPITGVRLRLEGLMSHPGMAPVTAMVTERGNGEYEAPLQFTMAGDWILVVTGELPGGGQIKKQIEINGVRQQ